MKVTITVGQTTREIEVRDYLLSRAWPDHAQDAAEQRVGAAFVDAYREEARRVKEERSVTWRRRFLDEI